jgi:hypothetical protein
MLLAQQWLGLRAPQHKKCTRLDPIAIKRVNLIE